MSQMPFDGIVTRAITKELRAELIGGRINKIYQPTDSELIITIRNKRKNHTLLLSIHPVYARIHLTAESFLNPAEPPMFCMVLRKHLAGAEIEQIEQFELERIIAFTLRGRNEIGDIVGKKLMVEIMGKHSNIVLLDTEQQKIINCMKHVPPFQNRHRTLQPGADYKFPPAQQKLDLLTAEADQFIRRLDFNAGKLDRQIVQTLSGISPFIAKELVHRTNLGSQTKYEQEFVQFQKEICEMEFSPAIYENKREDFHVLPISYLQAIKTFETTNELLDHFYANKAERDRVRQQARDLERLVKNELAKNERKLVIHEKTLEKAKRANTYQKYGELLTAHLHIVKKGAASVTVTDYYDDEQAQITIKLQTDKTPSENAQAYFKKYRKLAAAEKMARTELVKTRTEINYLENILQQMEQARDEDIADIREELREEGYMKQQRQKSRRRSKPKPEQFSSSDGTTIYVGKNNKQNEYVTHRLAHKEDIWLHTLDIPGSHVIIKDANPSEQTLLEAAQIAAYYSKARLSDSVPVDYTKVKYVKKPSGAKPGFVIYTDQQTLYVTPKKDIVTN